MRIADGELKNLLTVSGKVTPAQLADAAQTVTDTKEPLLATVLKKKLISEKDLLELYAKSIDIPPVELGGIKIPHELLLKIPERIARKYQAVIFGMEDDKLQLAMADPEDFQATDFIEKQIGTAVKIYIASTADITTALDQYQGNLDTEVAKAIKASSADEAAEVKVADVSPQDLAEDAPITKTVNVIIEYAMRLRASDIHIEPRENVVQVRYRIDGLLREAMTLPSTLLPAVISRIKILANLKIDEHRVPQDGRFKFTVGSKIVALRVSSLPVMDGEKIVMRLLDESSKALTLEELGFEGRSLNIITTNLHKPHGMTLVTGPTGSGKSTTLYSILNLLNTPGVNISTVEDPVEYRIAGVNQTQVNPKAGMTFAGGLRALLRQDPNIIMVGEIRDGETADLAVQAALTGHVVLSTLHTNNAATSLPRLLDMGVEPFLIASTVNTVIGQRLVRRLCTTCRVSYVPSTQEMSDIRKDFEVDAALRHYNEMMGTVAAIPATTPVAAPPAAPTLPAAVASNAPADPTNKVRGQMKVIEPLGPIEADKSILDKIAADPNIINRSAYEVAKAKIVSDAIAAPPVILPPAPVAVPAAPVVAAPLPNAATMTLYKAGPGCGDCGGASYQGRMGIYEVLEVNEEISKMIVNHATSDEIQVAAIKSGMLTMQQDGFLKCLRGQTTIEEILRVTRE